MKVGHGDDQRKAHTKNTCVTLLLFFYASKVKFPWKKCSRTINVLCIALVKRVALSALKALNKSPLLSWISSSYLPGWDHLQRRRCCPWPTRWPSSGPRVRSCRDWPHPGCSASPASPAGSWWWPPLRPLAPPSATRHFPGQTPARSRLRGSISSQLSTLWHNPDS